MASWQIGLRASGERAKERGTAPGRRTIRLCVAALAASLMASPTRAAQVTANFTVTITIIKQCTVTAPSAINFGSVGSSDLISTVTTAAQSFSVLCSTGTPYTIGFSSSNDLPSGGTTHVMKGALPGNTDTVNYQLTDTTLGALNIAPLSATSSIISGIGTGAAQNRTLQAKVINYTVPAAADVYTDTVTLSVTY